MAPRRRPAETTDELRASLIEHARRLVARGGASALTMRALAAETGCALGLPYKVFPDRQALVVELLRVEFAALRLAFDALVRRAGTGTVAGNLAWFAERLLDSPAVALGKEVFADAALATAVTAMARGTGIGHAAHEAVIADYLAAEKRCGRVESEVDEHAFAFVLFGAIHNLAVSGDLYPQPTRRHLRRLLAAVTARLAPPTQRPEVSASPRPDATATHPPAAAQPTKEPQT